MEKFYSIKSVGRALALSLALTCAVPQASAQSVQNAGFADEVKHKMAYQKAIDEQRKHEAEAQAMKLSAKEKGADSKDALMRLKAFRAASAKTRAADGKLLADSMVTTLADGTKYRNIVYGYDAQGRRISYVHYYLTDGKWKETYKYEHAFDENDNQTLVAGYSWKDGQGWVGTYKYEYAYDENRKQILNAYYGSWDDSKGWVGSYKYEYAYDANGNQTFYAGYNSWDSSNSTWVGDFSAVWEYNSAGQQTSECGYDWDKTTGKWVGSFRNEYEYEEKGGKSSRKYYDWESGAWVETLFYTYENTYNSNGLLIESIAKYNGTSQSSKDVYSYDSSSNLIEESDCYWSGSAWVNMNKHEYAYDSNGNQTKYASYYWSDSAWAGNYKYEYAYDNNGNRTMFAFYNSFSNSVWIGSYKYDREYNAASQQTKYIYYAWDSSKNTWVADSKYEYAYDADGINVSYTYSRWDTSKSAFVIQSTEEYFYDEAGNITYSNYYSFTDGTNKTLYSVSTYYYPSTTSINSVTTDDDGTVRIYDLQGRQRKTLGEGVNIVKANGKTMKVIKRR